jgi:deoxyhypusine synthase
MANNRGRTLLLGQDCEFDPFIGGGVPQDFTRLLAISLLPRADDEQLSGRTGFRRAGIREYYYPHRYAIQINTHAPQWDGLSAYTLDEAGRRVTCYCDATIALPLLTHPLCERPGPRQDVPGFDWLFDAAPVPGEGM